MSYFRGLSNKKVRSRELALYESANKFTVAHDLENIECFDLGPTDGPLIFMLHGWESNAGSFSNIAFRLAEKGNRVVLFNLPAHGYSKLKKANLKIGREVFLKVLEHIKPNGAFSVVGHSLGSAISAYTLSKTAYKIDQFVFLTCPNKFTDLFEKFGEFIGLNKSAFNNFCSRAESLLGEKLSSIAIEKYHSKINFSKALFIHDKMDKVISKYDTNSILENWPNSEAFWIEDSGHYKMLTDKSVIQKVLETFKKSNTKKHDLGFPCVKAN